jgi:hypothetical protein
MREFYGSRGPEQREERTWQDVAAPENQRCVATETELASAGPAASEGVTASTAGGPVGEAGPAASAATETERLDTRPLPANDGDLLCPVHGLARYAIGSVRWYVWDPEEPAPLGRGAESRPAWSTCPTTSKGDVRAAAPAGVPRSTTKSGPSTCARRTRSRPRSAGGAARSGSRARRRPRPSAPRAASGGCAEIARAEAARVRSSESGAAPHRAVGTAV